MTSDRADVVVVGAGPVGMAAALMAAKNGLSVILLEKHSKRLPQSRAIGITPPTLGIFERLGIADRFVARGVPVSRAGGFSLKRKLCTVDFSAIENTFTFVLAIPQHLTESVLEDAVSEQPNIRFTRGFEARTFDFGEGWCTVAGVDLHGRGVKVQGRNVMGCDGAKSVMRRQAGAGFCGKTYPHTFVMADYRDPTGWGREARLYFTARGSVESFPLPDGFRRFVLRTPGFTKDNPAGYLAREIPARCGVSVDTAERQWESAFCVEHYLATTFAVPRLYLCGDAAHVMSPIGGQNMNTGFADAELAVWLIAQVASGKADAAIASKVYDRCRRKAALAATARAELMMRAGTSGGTVWNALRNSTMTIAMNTPLRSVMNGMFTMLSLPNRDVPSCRAMLERELGRPKI